MNNNLTSLSDYTKFNNLQLADTAKGVSMPIAMAANANKFGSITVGFNNQLNGFLDVLGAKRAELAQTVQNELANNPNYMGSRNAGVKLAWQYEKADIEMGGTGSANWNKAEQDQILNSHTGTVSGAEGHHQKNVVDHPEHQANPDNIKFYKTKKDHLEQGHNGDFRNESDAPFIDKDKMLKRTNAKRVIKNELLGAGISAAIGFGISFTISAITELARMGIDSENMDAILSGSIRSGVEGGTIGLVTYGTGRLVSTLLQNSGIDLLTKTGALVNFAAVGVVSIALISTYQFIKMKINGIESSVAIREVGKQALFSISILAISIIAQGIYGGYAGLIVSTSVGIIFLTVGVISSTHKRNLEKKLKEYAIEAYNPIMIR